MQALIPPVRSGVNLASFAELAVRLVNSAFRASDADPLRSSTAFREFVADRPFLAVPVTQYDLDRLRLLRQELTTIFVAAAAGDAAKVAGKLNALLVTHPLHPVIVSHDGDERWHIHLHDSGSAADRYAAGAVSGLAMLVSQVGLHKIGICAMAACDRAFIDGSNNKSRRYCGEHRAAKGNVTSLHGEGEPVGLDAGKRVVSEAS
jgi:predicted RNA-binding Zn ribbon-like protein